MQNQTFQICSKLIQRMAQFQLKFKIFEVLRITYLSLIKTPTESMFFFVYIKKWEIAKEKVKSFNICEPDKFCAMKVS